jgi:hypothetical protein
MDHSLARIGAALGMALAQLAAAATIGGRGGDIDGIRRR